MASLHPDEPRNSAAIRDRLNAAKRAAADSSDASAAAGEASATAPDPADPESPDGKDPHHAANILSSMMMRSDANPSDEPK